MKEISIDELRDLFIDTLKRVNSDIYQKTEEEIEYDVLEEFDISFRSFLHQENLRKLLQSNCINDDTFQMAKEIFTIASSIPENRWTATNIVKDSDWKQIFLLSDRILKLVDN